MDINTYFEIMQAQSQRCEWLKNHVGITTVYEHEALMKRYYDLCNMTEIPAMAEHALAWRMLGADFTDAQRPAMAARCDSDGARYEQMQAGEYKRTQTGRSLTELEPVYHA